MRAADGSPRRWSTRSRGTAGPATTPRSPATTTIATLDFGDGPPALYDFTDNQWHNQLRFRRIVVRGTHGELRDDELVRLAAPRTIVRTPLVRRQTGYDLDLDGFDTDHIALGGRGALPQPVPGAALERRGDRDRYAAGGDRRMATPRRAAALPAGRRLPRPSCRAGDPRGRRHRPDGHHDRRDLVLLERCDGHRLPGTSSAHRPARAEADGSADVPPRKMLAAVLVPMSYLRFAFGFGSSAVGTLPGALPMRTASVLPNLIGSLALAGPVELARQVEIDPDPRAGRGGEAVLPAAHRVGSAPRCSGSR